MSSRVALVTGGTGGIGTAIVKRLADMGHKVATNYRNEERARAWQARPSPRMSRVRRATGSPVSTSRMPGPAASAMMSATKG